MIQAIRVFGLAVALMGPAGAQKTVPDAAPANSPAAGLPLESVTVTDLRHVPDQVIAKFVESITSPSRARKLTRWKQGVCPKTTGLASNLTDQISRRIREIATQAGAPVDAAESCRVNIHVMFIDQPQQQLDELRKRSPDYFGYYDSSAQLERLATFTRPIQSWYTTQTRDSRGASSMDSHNSGGEVAIPIFCYTPPRMPPQCTSTDTILIPKATVADVTGGQLNDGLSSEFYHVLVVADPAKVGTIEIGGLADYIAMLSLSQIEKPDVCTALPSILNLMAPECPLRPAAITESDMAFLHGLYKMSGTANLNGQREQVSYQMRQSLADEKK
jgi:hypothetical protein